MCVSAYKKTTDTDKSYRYHRIDNTLSIKKKCWAQNWDCLRKLMICIPIGFRCGYWPRLQANVNAPALRRHTFFFRLRGHSDCISHFWNEKTVTNRIKQIFQDWRPLKWSFAHAKISEFLLVYSGEPTCFPYTCCFTYGLGESNKKKNSGNGMFVLYFSSSHCQHQQHRYNTEWDDKNIRNSSMTQRLLYIYMYIQKHFTELERVVSTVKFVQWNGIVTILWIQKTFNQPVVPITFSCIAIIPIDPCNRNLNKNKNT